MLKSPNALYVFKRALKFLIGNRAYWKLSMYKTRILNLKNFNLKIQNKDVSFSIHGDYHDSFIFGTEQGIYLYDRGRLIQLFSGGAFRAIIKRGSRWYAIQNISPWLLGRLFSFEIKDGRAANVRTEKFFYHQHIHQMAVTEDKMYIVDPGTHPNQVRILKFVNNNRLKKERNVAFIDPPGFVLDPEDNDSVVNEPKNQHINSIFINNNKVYILCHNRFRITGKKSEVIKAGRDLNNFVRIEIDGKECHNFAIYKGKQIFCSSLESTVVWGNKKITLDAFDGLYVRGLACGEKAIIVGGPIKQERAYRKKADSLILGIDPQSQTLLFELTVPTGGQIFEIRLVSVRDFGM